MARRSDPVKIRAALTAQWQALADYTEKLTEEQLAEPSSLPGWSVRVLVAHIAHGAGAVARGLGRPDASRAKLDLAGWAAAAPTIAADVDVRARTAAERGLTVADQAAASQQAMAGLTGDRTVTIQAGALRLDDLLVTRVVEAVVHADDLDPAFPHDRGALSIAVRALADILTARTPGRTVELRVPPYAAVQCVEGPRHARGTPPNVVETDPLTWIRLAAGRMTWARAVADGRVMASGQRADLAPYLPVLA